MPGKPFQSKLIPYENELFSLLDEGRSFRQVAEELNRAHRLGITHNAVFSFAKSRRKRRGARLFYEGLSPDIRDQLLKKVAAVWTHDSTAIEGNTLTLGDTVKILELGLTISGKSLREHQEVYGHARAIDLVYQMLRQPGITEDDLFALHRAVMPLSPIDALNPVGGWKQSYNGTTGVADGKVVFMEYADPLAVPDLMNRWIETFNASFDGICRPADAIRAYVQAHTGFVRIHPFFDGNGRVARLVANIPVLRAGYPPIIVPSQRRGNYIDLLWEYEFAVGKIRADAPLVPAHPALARFVHLLQTEWQRILTPVEEARRLETERTGQKKTSLVAKPVRKRNPST